MGRKIRTQQIKKASCGVWMKRNWVLLGLVALAVAGVVLSILLLFEPCKEKTETVKVNQTRVIETNYNATVQVNVTRSLIHDLEYGVVQWGCDAREVIAPTPYESSLLGAMAGMEQRVQLQTLNIFALMDCYDQHHDSGDDAFKICQFITDGAPTQADKLWEDVDQVVKKASYNGAPIWCNITKERGHGWCEAHGVATCTLLGVSDFLKERGFALHYIVVEPSDNYESGMMRVPRASTREPRTTRNARGPRRARGREREGEREREREGERERERTREREGEREHSSSITCIYVEFGPL